MKVTKAIIPVAGWGTRRLPITKSIEKCMLPLLNRPLIDYVVEDCIKAGITDIYFVISKGATQLKDYYGHNTQLEEYLKRSGKTDALASVQPPTGVTFHYIEQDPDDARYGTAIPVWLCRDYIAPDEPVFITMGDELLYRVGGSVVQDFIASVTESGADGGVVGIPMPDDPALRYGFFQVNPAGEFQGIIEHPTADDPVVDIKNVSMYLVGGDFLRHVSEFVNSRPAGEGEYYILNPLSAYIASGKRLTIHQSDAEYLECGTVDNWVAANNYLLEVTKP